MASYGGSDCLSALTPTNFRTPIAFGFEGENATLDMPSLKAELAKTLSISRSLQDASYLMVTV